jgi:hypothetical protein
VALERQKLAAEQVAHGMTAPLCERVEYHEQIARSGAHRCEPAPRQRGKVIEWRPDDRLVSRLAARPAHCRGLVRASQLR